MGSNFYPSGALIVPGPWDKEPSVLYFTVCLLLWIQLLQKAVLGEKWKQNHRNKSKLDCCCRRRGLYSHSHTGALYIDKFFLLREHFFLFCFLDVVCLGFLQITWCLSQINALQINDDVHVGSILLHDIYALEINCGEVDQMEWIPLTSQRFQVKCYYYMVLRRGSSFPWQRSWKVRVLLSVAFFLWCVMLDKKLLRKQIVIIMDWYFM